MQSTEESSNGLEAIRKIALERLNWSRGFLHAGLSGMSEEQLLVRAGGKGNHAIWVMGHLAVAEDNILALMTGKAHHLAEEYRKLFGMGSEPGSNGSHYPSRNALNDALHSTRERIADWVKNLDEVRAYQPNPDRFQRFAPNAITVPFGIAAHEMLHAGQIATVRSVLGLPRIIT